MLTDQATRQTGFSTDETLREREIWRAEYPFESKFLDLGGHRYHYLDEGAGRETMLFAHGNPTWSFYWRKLIVHFRDRYRVIAVDHMGCGLSDKPQVYPYTLDQHIRNLLSLVDSLSLEHVTLVAHDWGGAIGLGAATRRPTIFDRLALMNTGAFRSDRMPWRIAACRVPVLGPLAVRGLNGFARAALWMAVNDRGKLTPLAKAGLLAPYDSWSHRVAIQRFVEDIPMRRDHPSYRALVDIEERLPTLGDKRVALVWGMRDWCFTPMFRDRFLDFFPNATSTELADVGHYLVEEAPGRVIAAVEALLNGDAA